MDLNKKKTVGEEKGVRRNTTMLELRYSSKTSKNTLI